MFVIDWPIDSPAPATCNLHHSLPMANARPIGPPSNRPFGPIGPNLIASNGMIHAPAPSQPIDLLARLVSSRQQAAPSSSSRGGRATVSCAAWQQATLALQAPPELPLSGCLSETEPHLGAPSEFGHQKGADNELWARGG